MDPEPSLRAFRTELAEHFRHDPAITPVLKSALVWACLTPKPPRTRKGLARKAELSEVTLWRHERKSFPNGPRLHDVQQFIALVADLEVFFGATTASESDRHEVRNRALQAFGVFPLDEREAEWAAVTR
jgi:hypothetical protein